MFGQHRQVAVAGAALLILLLSLTAAFAAAPHLQQLNFPGQPLTRDTVKLQLAADELYQRKRFDEAFKLYREDLAPGGDKYAQYMVGYLLQQGQGVKADPVAAYAWLRLAAQRGDPSLLSALQEHRLALKESQVQRGEQAYGALNAELGDEALLRDMIRADQACVRSQTGSRVGGERLRRVFVYGNNCAGVDNTDVKKRLKDRQEYLRRYQEAGTP